MDPIAAPDEIWLSTAQFEEMRRLVERADPEEACGIVAGKGNVARRIIPVENVLHSPTRFRMDPESAVEGFNAMMDDDLELLAIYHSHPDGPPFPSMVDIREASYPNAVQLIWHTDRGRWTCDGYLVHRDGYTKIRINWTD